MEKSHGVEHEHQTFSKIDEETFAKCSNLLGCREEVRVWQTEKCQKHEARFQSAWASEDVCNCISTWITRGLAPREGGLAWNWHFEWFEPTPSAVVSVASSQAKGSKGISWKQPEEGENSKEQVYVWCAVLLSEGVG